MGSNYLITLDGNFASEDELYHWGIKGMKWGVRRYQNPDGSLTSAGRKRYIGSDGSLTKAGKKYYAKETERLKNERKSLTAQKRTASKLSKLEIMRKGNDDLKSQLGGKKKDSANGDASKKKSLKDMSDDEIREAINRSRLEDEYRRTHPQPPSKTEKLGKFMDKLMNDAIVPATINAGKNALNKWAENLLKTKVDPNSYEALKKQYDTLSIKKKIADLKAGKDPDAKPASWDERLKEQQYRANEERAEREAAERQAKADKEAAERQTKADKEAKAERDRIRKSHYDNAFSRSENTKQNNREADSAFYDKNKSRQDDYDFGNNTSSGKSSKKKNKASSTVTVEGTGNNSWSRKATDSNYYSGSSVVDARSDDSVTSMATSSNASRGRSAISGYLNNPISGYLPAPKDRDD